MAKQSITGKIVCKYLAKFPNTPSHSLAKKIYKENKESFTNTEHVRSVVRMYRGKSGGRNRKNITLKDHFKKEDGAVNPFDLPESYADPFTSFILNQSKTLIISDLHFPYQHNEAITKALQYGLKKKINCILINGDLIDFATISRHEKDFRNRSVAVEFESVRVFLKSLRDAFPNARIIYKYGNHDERWEKWLYVKAPEIFDCSDFQLEVILRLGELKIEVVKNKLPIRIGKLTVLHGHELAGGSGGVNPARGAFLKTLESVVIGHFHKTSSNTESTMYGDVISVHSTGCLCGMNPSYMPINKWNLGFSYVECNVKTGQYHLENLKIIKGKVY